MRLAVSLALTFLSLTAGVAAQQTQSPPSGGTGNKLFSEELNSELPKWISFGGEYRARVEGFTGGGFKVNKRYVLATSNRHT